MKKFVLLFLFVAIFSFLLSDTIWQEDFSSYTEGTGINGYGNIGDYPSGVSKWSLDVSGGTLTGSSDYLKTRNGKLEARDVDGNVIWLSETIITTNYSNISFSITISETGDLESADYADLFYSVNGNGFVRVENWQNLGNSYHTLVGDKPNDSDWQTTTITVSDLNIDKLQIKVGLKINAGTEYIQIDDITVTGEPTGNNEYYSSISSSLTGDDLKAALHNLIKGHTTYGYNSSTANRIMMEADEDPNHPGYLIEIYTGDSEDYISSREHVWAKSHGDFGTSRPTGSDLHNLKPCQQNINSTRGSKDFDNGGSEVSGAPGNYTDSDSWEPRDEVKGDVARILFYMAVRYEGDVAGEPDLELVNGVNTKDNTISGEYGEIGNLSVLLQWNEMDPVDSFERHRNEVIYSYQHNRNPFIDHPEWVNEIWNSQSGTPSVIISEICDPKYNYRDNRFIEICNVGNGSQNLNGWQVIAVANGNDVLTWDLSGSIDAGEVFTFGTNSADVTIDFQSDDWYSANRYWNGGANDGAKLVDNNGNIVDIIVASSYLFNDKSLRRDPEILEPSGNNTELSEWTSYSANYAYNGTPGEHSYGRENYSVPQIIIANLNNYPNPFNPLTNIEFSANQYISKADVSIYNLKGQKVITIYNGSLEKNKAYKFIWNGVNSYGKSSSSGIYFIRLSSDNVSQVRKITLLK